MKNVKKKYVSPKLNKLGSITELTLANMDPGFGDQTYVITNQVTGEVASECS
jgi:hypothetical protein